MSNNAFGGYNKPNFQPKNITSDMWEPITTTNNFSAYTPDREPKQADKKISSVTRQSSAKKTASSPTREQIKRQRPEKQNKKAPASKAKKTDNKSAVKKQKPQKQQKAAPKQRTISSGSVPTIKPQKQRNVSKRKMSALEKRHKKNNIAFVKLVKSGKTHDEARVIINRRKIRLNKIKTFGTVGLFTVFALCFLLSYSYFRGAEIKEILFEGDEVYAENEILEAGGIATGQNMLTVHENKLNKEVTALLPFISKIDVDYRLPDVLALNIVSTKEQLILKCDRKYICVDSQGKVVADIKKKLTEGQFLVQGLVMQEYTVGETFKVSEENAERFRVASEFAKIAEKADTLNYGVLDLKDMSDITFTYRSRIRLYLGDSSNLSDKLQKAISIMQSAEIGEKTGYINLKYDIGAYFMEGTME